MAKPRYELNHLERNENVAFLVKREFSKAMADLQKCAHIIPNIDEGYMYSFSLERRAMQAKVKNILHRLHSAILAIIEEGVEVEWGQAISDIDAIMKGAVAGSILSDAMQSKAESNAHLRARKEFLNRREGGLGLSDRVWKDVTAFRDQMEVALTVGIGEGKSARSLSQDIRSSLSEPDLMFRRFRYKRKDADGNTEKEWRTKWKKKVIDADGKVRWVDQDKDSYKTGRGVYKSAYKNAMRVARTETNMAYRRASNARWQNYDFVLGQEIHLSHNHDLPDICNRLAGKYPKEFVFSGWHPHCLCYSTPILCDIEEMKKIKQAIERGETYIPKGKITDTPQAFKDWVSEHKDKYLELMAEDKTPYFIKDNMGWASDILGVEKSEPEIAPLEPDVAPSEEPRLSILERAEKRHAERTEGDIERIKNRWYMRNAKGAFDKMAELRKYGEVDLEEVYNMLNKRGDLKEINAILDQAMEKVVKEIERQVAEYDKTISPELKANLDEIAKRLNIPRRAPMTTEEADMQSANPKYKRGTPYGVNCATCAPTYMLRRHGLYVTAGANTKKAGNTCYKLSRNWTDAWGLDASNGYSTIFKSKEWSPLLQWMRDHKYKRMSDKRYLAFIEEKTKEDGVYEFALSWKNERAGHATILQREHGVLSYIEPQAWNQKTRHSVTELVKKLRLNPYTSDGIMRIDNRIFNIDYLDALEK